MYCYFIRLFDAPSSPVLAPPQFENRCCMSSGLVSVWEIEITGVLFILVIQNCPGERTEPARQSVLVPISRLRKVHFLRPNCARSAVLAIQVGVAGENIRFYAVLISCEYDLRGCVSVAVFGQLKTCQR